nr:hypothetical protein [Tanacetum cinerariifolium]
MAGSKGKQVMNTPSFYKMETDEISEWYIALCFMNDLEAYDGEINLAFDENLLSNEFEIKLCLDYEMKKGKKLAKKELIVALKGEIYFVNVIINPEEDDFEHGVVLERSFMRLAKGVVDFGNRVTTIYPEPDPFEDDSKKQERAQTIGINYLILILMIRQSLEKNFHHLYARWERETVTKREQWRTLIYSIKILDHLCKTHMKNTVKIKNFTSIKS